MLGLHWPKMLDGLHGLASLRHQETKLLVEFSLQVGNGDLQVLIVIPELSILLLHLVNHAIPDVELQLELVLDLSKGSLTLMCSLIFFSISWVSSSSRK